MIFLKLGGSAITDKTREATAREDVICRVAHEIKRARDASQNPALGILIGRGSGDGFAMGFAANLHAVDLNPGMIRPLLKRARAIFDADTPPAPRGLRRLRARG